MKIGIACYPTFGGSGVVATELGHELASRGHDVHFISYALPSRLNLFQRGVSYHEVAVPTYPLFNYPPYDLALATRIVDVALLPEARRGGIGTRLVRDVQERAAAAGKSVTIHVERMNPALRLYERLGFRLAEDKGVYLFLSWRADAVS